MSVSDNNRKETNNLRERAEALLSKAQDSSPSDTPENAWQLAHELDTHRIELELQNQTLRDAEEKFQDCHQRYVDLYDFAPVGYLTVNGKGIITEANLTAAEMLGRQRNHLLKHPFTHFIYDDEQDIHYQSTKKLIATKEPQTYELHMRNNDGNLFYAQLKSAIGPRSDQDTGQFRVCLTDITVLRKEIKENLQKSRNEWENTFDSIADLITIQDSDMRIVRANKAVYDFFQISPTELLGKYCYELFSGVMSPCPGCPVIKTHCDKSHHSEIVQHDGLKKVFFVSSTPILDSNGYTQNFVHIAKDITKQKQLEEQIFQKHKMEAIGTLAGGIAHDFNNILTAVIGFTDLAVTAIPESSPAKQYLAHVQKAGQRAKELVRQILTFSRKKQIDVGPLLPASIVKEVAKLMRASLPSTITLTEEIDSQSGAILADPTQLHQILLNLCTNAFHAIGDKKGTLSIKLFREIITEKECSDTLEKTGPFIVLTVSDTGVGIKKENLKKIYEPYYTTKENGEGTGMGLAVVFGIVQKYGGMIQVESYEGQGTTFKVYFPAFSDESALPSENGSEDVLPTGTERILVVDDEEAIAEVQQNILEQLGYQVTKKTDSEEALLEFRNRAKEFDLVLSDQTMPNLTGSELSAELLKLRPEIPIILCTGYSSMRAEDQSLPMGIKKFLIKPVNLKNLALTVRQVLDENR